jgi:ubiquinone biosynthesis monooxygenase Coq7
MELAARLKSGETLGDRIIKVDHAGEHGAICIYQAQRWVSLWRTPSIVAEIEGFLAHEKRHRTLFEAELERRGRKRCRSYHFCAVGGLALGLLTGLAGRQAIAATTVAVEKVVLRHLAEQESALAGIDPAAAEVVRQIIADERNHHDTAEDQLDRNSVWVRIIEPVVAAATEAVIWLGMKL